MISEEKNKPHQKHANLTRPNLGTFGRSEISITGTPCANIKRLANIIIRQLSAFKISYVDAEHKSADDIEITNIRALANGGFIEYTDRIGFQRVEFKNKLTSYQMKTLFNEQDLVMVNGNHFTAKCQIAVIDPVKKLEKKLKELTDVQLILLKEPASALPAFLHELPNSENIPVLPLEDETGIIDFVKRFLTERKPPLHGLVLSGGQSSRMKKDKGSLNYHGKSQREFLLDQLSKHCEQAFVSCNQEQAGDIAGKLPIIQDSFLHLGPMGGILSAFQSNPNAAWLTIACDLPYLSEKTIEYLVQNRDPSKCATAFFDQQGEFPEPLITIWEPKSYPVLLQFLGQGYSCPRKALINSDILLLKAPDAIEFLNANFPDQHDQVLQDLKGAKK